MVLKNTKKQVSPDKSQLKKYQKFSEDIAYQAGEILLKYSKRIESLEVHYKDAQGVASNADLASEKFITEAIRKHFPDHSILAEEDAYGKNGEHLINLHINGYSWIIDPLDGTNNFLAGLNYYAVCIALAFNGKPVVGIVYRPATGECFTSYKGGGSYLKNFRNKGRSKRLVNLPKSKALKDTMVATGFFSEKGKHVDSEFAAFRAIVESTRAVRRLGSAALDLCFVAQGIYDGFWEIGLAAWDVAAAGLICQEAGIKVTGFSGDNFSPFSGEIVAGEKGVNANLSKILRKFFT